MGRFGRFPSGWIGQLSCLTIFSTNLLVAAFLRRAGSSMLDSTGSYGIGVERRVPEMRRMVEFNCRLGRSTLLQNSKVPELYWSLLINIDTVIIVTIIVIHHHHYITTKCYYMKLSFSNCTCITDNIYAQLLASSNNTNPFNSIHCKFWYGNCLLETCYYVSETYNHIFHILGTTLHLNELCWLWKPFLGSYMNKQSCSVATILVPIKKAYYYCGMPH